MEDFDNDEWAEMQEMYIKHTSKELDKILDSDSLDAIRIFGHNIKGSGGMYGFDEVKKQYQEIESEIQKLISLDSDYIKDFFANII